MPSRPALFRLGLALAVLLMPGTIMAQQCPLSAPLTLKDTQSGFAGETGTVWTIAPDCSFTVARQIGRKILESHKHGELTPEQQSQLKALLDRVTAADLPAQLGGEPQVNARRITLSHGGKTSVLTLPPGGSPSAAADNDAARELFELVEAVRGMMGR